MSDDELWRWPATRAGDRDPRPELTCARRWTRTCGASRPSTRAQRDRHPRRGAALREAARGDDAPARGGARRRCTACRSPSRTSRTPRACARPTARRCSATTCQRGHAAGRPAAPGGRIVIGKTNTPEFGAGSQTFNAVFGATRNPYDSRARRRQQRRRGGRVAAACSRSPTGPTRRLASATRPRSATSSGCGLARPRAGGAVGLCVESDERARPAGAQRRGRRAAAASDGRP